MIRLNVFVKIKPEEREEIIATANALVEKSLQEKGCIAYGCFANTTDPTVFLICETWADENALAAARGSLRENGKLILCLSDKDLIELIDIKDKNEQPAGLFFEAMLDDLLIHLEK